MEIQCPGKLEQFLTVPIRSLWHRKGKTRKWEERERAMARRVEEGVRFIPEGRHSLRCVSRQQPSLRLLPLFASDRCFFGVKCTTSRAYNVRAKDASS